ncbi:MAG: oligosaccharide flippase family protein [Phycisphaerales bacterium]
MGQMRGDGLRARALRGSTWTVAGFGASQVLRLGSNLILTRLLFPEAFGLMALAQVFMQGLKMLSDIGVGPSIVQNERGDDPDFLATAWTMQVIRGFTLFLCMCAIAYPASLFYDQPILFPILMLLGTTSIIQGFQSIGISTASRKMALGRLTMLDLISQSVSIVVIIVWAYFSRDVWAIVGGGIVGSMVKVVLGHQLLGSRGNRFHFERSAAHEIFHFGKWIFLATALTYFGGQGLRLVQGALVSFDTLGLIAIAGIFVMAVNSIVNRLARAALFPAISEIQRERPGQFAERVVAARILLIKLSSPCFIGLILFGQALVELLYDQRYSPAGEYVVIMAVSGGVASIKAFFAESLLAQGRTRDHAVVCVAGSILNLAGVIVGYEVAGVSGMLWGAVLALLLVYPVEATFVSRCGIWTPLRDVVGFLAYVLLGVFSIVLL